MIRSLYRGGALAIIIVLWAGLAQAAQYAALVMDARTGKVVHSRNADTQLHPASLTKMMTLYIVFDQVRQGRLSLDQKIRISSNAASEPPSKLGLRAGQSIELRYLIRAAAVKSANDAATAMGEAVAGSESAFTDLMNKYAAAMGMKRTNFENAHGLTASGHLSTARDMTLLGRRLVYDFPQYYNLFSRRSTSAGIKTVSNTNRRVLDAYPGADGIKTGYTRAAGFNLTSSAKRGDKRVIVTVMGGKSSATRNAEVIRLMDLGFGRMPRVARLDPPAPLRMRSVAVAEAESVGGSTSGISPARVAVLSRSTRPVPRSAANASVPVARSSATIAQAIEDVNTDLASAQMPRSTFDFLNLNGRPAPRPIAEGSAEEVYTAQATNPGSASTFASSPASATPRPAPQPDSLTVPVALTSAPTSTGGNSWGVQIGVHRAKTDAERQLLTTALKDVPQLAGSLRRIEPATVSGLRVYRAQFVGLSQQNAVSACQTLQRLNSDCAPIAPGT
ncbi:serine hydrolase [Amaricoccus macauensis]|uniref:serine hydrolase n=1 Tax=Amaricoccus macauensis TaxID=57001 RepID=UPI003C7DD72E